MAGVWYIPSGSVELSWKDARPELSNTAVAAEPIASTTAAPCGT